MATSSSFKQQCPSCEAMVPIRDPGLVGKKIDCPKCKYRFLVEEPIPEEEAEGEEAEPEAKGKGKKSTAVTDKKGKAKRLRDDEVGPDEDEEGAEKKASNPMMLYGGIGLGVVALVALVGGGILLFGGGSKPPTQAAAPPPAGGPPKSVAPPPAPPAAPAAAPVVDAGGATDNIKNLLPNNTATLVSWNLDLLLKSAVKAGLVQTPGAFTEATFVRSFNFPMEDVTQLLTAVLPSDRPGTPAFFSIVQVKNPIDRDVVIRTLKLTPLPAVNGFDSFDVGGDFDTLGTFFLRLSSPPAGKISLHFLDAQTVVVADAEPLQKFLEDKRQPKQMTQPPPPAPEPGGPKAAVPVGPGAIQRSRGAQPAPTVPKSDDGTQSRRETLFQAPPGGPPMPGQQGIPKGPPPAPGAPPPGGGIRPGQPPAPGAPPAGAPPAGAPGAPPAGAAGAAPADDAPAPPVPQGVEAEPTASDSYLTIDPSLKIAIDRLEHDKEPMIFFAAGLLKDTGLPEQATSLAVLDRQMIDQLFPHEGMPAGTRVLAVALRDFSEGKSSGMVVLQCETAELARGAKLAVDAFAGEVITLLRTHWEMDVKLNTAGAPQGQPANRGLAGRFQNLPPVQPQPGDAPAGPAPTGKDGIITTWTRLKTVSATIELNLSRKLYEAIRDGLAAEMVQLKGHAELVASRIRVHELSRAIQAYVKARGAFPRATLPRAPSSDRNLDWYPDQRLSWMAELLPFLGDGEFKDLQVDPDKAWNEAPNLLTAQVLIPQFLSPGDRKSAHVHFPGKLGSFATTRFVGVAGVGLDAAAYPANAAYAKRVGMFGYDRVTKPEDVKDELENTIAVLQIPSGQITPWLLGGGSTVRGIPEGDNPVRPFVSTEYKGKRGTFAIMADGKVRFIPEDIKPDVFRAMCTIAGGERLPDLNEVAPVVPEEGPAELKASATPLVDGKPAPDAKPAADAKPPAEAAPSTAAAAPPAAAAPAAKSNLPVGWKEVTNAEGGYTVALPPGAPVTQQLPALPGMQGGTIAGVRMEGDRATFLVTSMKLPAPLPPAQAASMLATLRDQALKAQASAKVVSENKIQLGDNPGVEMVVEGAQGAKLMIKCYVVKDRAYSLAVVPLAKAEAKEVQAFFESFRPTGM